MRLCSVLIIGIPVLRLKGDYLAIVTLAFGEIIKNLINVFCIGKDANGFHFSMKDAMSLEHGSGRQMLSSTDAQGITGTPNDCYLYHRHDPGTDHPVYRIESDQFQRRTCDHVYP